jgi:hypothetical protein
MYGHIITVTGWKYSDVDALTLWQVHELIEYWNEYPPVHILVGAYLGVGGQKEFSTPVNSGSREELMQDVAGMGGVVNVSS